MSLVDKERLLNKMIKSFNSRNSLNSLSFLIRFCLKINQAQLIAHKNLRRIRYQLILGIPQQLRNQLHHKINSLKN